MIRYFKNPLRPFLKENVLRLSTASPYFSSPVLRPQRYAFFGIFISAAVTKARSTQNIKFQFFLKLLKLCTAKNCYLCNCV